MRNMPSSRGLAHARVLTHEPRLVAATFSCISPRAPLAHAEPTRTAAKCDLHNRERTVCCRDLKGDDERHLINPDIVRDCIMCAHSSLGCVSPRVLC